METLENLERQVKKLNPKEFVKFRNWLLELDWEEWDRQLERDVKAGKLDALARKALDEHAAGKTTPL